ncbi:hypothetical protein [Thiorhodovibrio litoralis]|uniref:hypothetical protein n=1 Tax=Thiorhodovibrio litoralis TaxID=2952932 RepID=UPI002B25CD6E|nr:hypothetical protein [Thiorhodovibrio litoralis]
MGTEPTAEQLTQLLSALESLRENSPSAAAKAASALVDVAWDNAPDNPQTAMAQLDIAHAILCHPAVAAAEPEIVENALAQLQGATRLAERSAATTGTELTGTDIAPDVGTCAAEAPEDLIAEAIELADAQADLAGFTTAAGGPPATNSAAGAVGAAPTPSFVSFSSPPGGGGGGGAVDPPTPVASPAG